MAELPMGSPLWWAEKLTPKLTAQATTARYYQDYFDGRHPMSFVITAKYREAFGQMLRGVTDNWMPIVVDAVAERLSVQGVRFSSDIDADDQAWAIWQANGLDEDALLAHRTALTCGRAALMVWAGDDGEPEITVEHPSEVAVAYAAGSRRKRAAAIKAFKCEWTDEKRVNIYLPEGLWKFVADPRTGWRLVESLPNPLGVVPVVELRNRVDLAGCTRSELAEVTSAQDQINKLVSDMMIAAEFGAFRQRWAVGLEVPVDEETGKPIEPFKAAIDRLWTAADENVKFGEFAATDLTGYIKAIESRIQSLASRSRTPPHYLLGGSAVMPSGESIKSAETGLVAKVLERQTAFGEAWEEALRMAFLVAGDTVRGSDRACEMIWKDPEQRTESEHIDALVKKLSMGVPKAQLWEDAGYSPQQIDRFRLMLLEEAFAQQQALPPAPIPISTAPVAA